MATDIDVRKPILRVDADASPPYNLELERKVLGGLLHDNSKIAEVAELLIPEDFFRDIHSKVFEIIVEMHEKGAPVDGPILAEEMERRGMFAPFEGDDLVASLVTATPHGLMAPHYAGFIRDHSITRQVLEAADDIRREGYSKQFTARELVDRALARTNYLETISVDEGADNRRFSEALDRLKPWPEPMGEAAYYGLAGKIIGAIAPHTEADPHAVLVQFLVAVANWFDRKPYWQVEATRHYLNMFCCIVGDSSKARKGTSWDIVRWLLGQSELDGVAPDHSWAHNRIVSGLASGEGMITEVRDASVKSKPKDGGLFGEFTNVMEDPGVSDKRALWIESEFGGTLGILNRDGNSLSMQIRNAWDKGDLRTASKNNPTRCSNAHISIIGHVTTGELHRRLTSVDAANGFANRFLWVSARRSQALAFGGKFHTIDTAPLLAGLRGAAAFVRDGDWLGPMRMTRAAEKMWEPLYDELSTPRPEPLGVYTSRAESQTLRLAAIYAVLDQSYRIKRCHLEAGLEVWRYCDRSAAYIFGGDKEVDRLGEKVLETIRNAGEKGMKLSAIGKQLFSSRNLMKRDEILISLMRQGLIERQPPEGQIKRPNDPVTWRARVSRPASSAFSASSTQVDASSDGDEEV